MPDTRGSTIAFLPDCCDRGSEGCRPADTETINQMRLWLLQSKRTQAWDTPINTVNAVYAFLDGNYKKLSSDKEESMTLAVDGKNKSLPKASAGLGYTKVVYDIDKQISLTLTKTGEGTSWGAAYAQFTQAAADIADSKSGIKVVRQVMVPENGKAAKGGALNVGDRIAVRITITADRDYDFVQVVDKRAACMEPVAQTSGYGMGILLHTEGQRHPLLLRPSLERRARGGDGVLYRPCRKLHRRNMYRAVCLLS